jgi:16S rRNA (guanine1516-N2)-methyltransferase
MSGLTFLYKQKIAVSASELECQNCAKELASKLRLPLAEATEKKFPLLLMVTPLRLELRQIGTTKTNPIYVDFLSRKMVQRYKYGGGRSQLIARAIGLKPGLKPTVLDVTAGLGNDAYVLASLGCQVTMLERSPVLVALLEDGLKRLFDNSTFAKSLKIKLIQTDSKDYLRTLGKNLEFDVIYIDPMYPLSRKSALPKKELRVLRTIVGDDSDAPQLLTLALQHAKKRVVVKRGFLAPAILGPKPDIIFRGQSTRFDVYII